MIEHEGRSDDTELLFATLFILLVQYQVSQHVRTRSEMSETYLNSSWHLTDDWPSHK